MLIRLPYCPAVPPYVLSESPSCSVKSVCYLPGPNISLDPSHPICATQGIICPTPPQGEDFEAKDPEEFTWSSLCFMDHVYDQTRLLLANLL
ncbi:unnamed protein product [Protopolystoma xenopodis]|uniref:Uncharacterized protein n=1 Tax=Protopolystoma xenopodis TaxID=117903 RepID=A0A3S5BMC8_9PLAT|nr:unnamed protein product [Protopolystoma xenopodis]